MSSGLFNSRVERLIRKIFGAVLGKGPTILYKGYVQNLVWLSQVAVRLRGIKRIKVLDEDWDYLIVLDACRYDYFEKYNTIKGALERKTSRGSCTTEWLRANFPEYYDDVVYISGNPYISNVERFGFVGTEHFHKVEPCWDYGWDPETGTVHPKSVVVAALKAKRRFPNKRMIIHFMQPHAPYIGRTRLSLKNLVKKGDERALIYKDEKMYPARGRAMHLIWRKVRRGQIPINVIKRAYEDNLTLVMEEVAKLVEQLDGRIVITADHGECFQEWFLTAHPKGVCLKPLINIPWLVIEKDKKRGPARSIEPPEPNEREKERIRERVKSLRSLGKI